MGKKIVRVGDYHQCPMWDGKTPHVGGPVLTGIPNVWVNGRQVAVVGSLAQCNCGVDTIVAGDPRLTINGLAVATEGCATAHGGQVVQASANVSTGGNVQMPNAEALKAEWEAALAELGDDHPAADAIRQCLSYLGPKPESLIDYPPVAMMEPGEVLPDPYPPREDQAHLKPVTIFSQPEASEQAETASTDGQETPAEDETEADTPTRKRVVINAGFFFDGTANNRFNTDDADAVRPDFNDLRRWYGHDPEEALQSKEYKRWKEWVEEKGMSYGNAYTNIARLQRLYFDARRDFPDRLEYGFSLYIEGIGTVSHGEDSTWGMATGMGETGVVAKAFRAREEFIDSFKKRNLSGEVHSGEYELVVDVFGFSRGAAAARHFVNMLIDDKLRLETDQRTVDRYPSYSFLRPVLEAGLPIPKSIEIRFLGLYDTVPAISNWPEGDFSPHNDDNDPVRLYVRPEYIGYAVQFCARDEFRYNFSLTSLRNRDGTLAPNCREYVLPGAHADIGGGYHHHDVDHVLLMPDVTVADIQGPKDSAPYTRTPEYLEREALIDKVIDAGWCTADAIYLEATKLRGAAENGVHEATTVDWKGETRQKTLIGTRRQIRLSLRMSRFMHNDYSRIPLYLMHEAAQIQGVPFMDLEEPNDFTNDIDPDNDPKMKYSSARLHETRLSGPLVQIWRRLRNQMRQGDSCPLGEDTIRCLRRRWLHYSANWKSEYKVLHPHAPAKKRAVYPNA